MKENIRSYNVGSSDYSKFKFQIWDLWIDYELNPFDGDLLKRDLRHKSTDPRQMDYEKIIHICKERIRQYECKENVFYYNEKNHKYSVNDVIKEYKLNEYDSKIVELILIPSKNRIDDYKKIIDICEKLI